MIVLSRGFVPLCFVRLARGKEERRRLFEEEKLRDEEEARERFLLEQEMAKEDNERQSMAQHDEDIGGCLDTCEAIYLLVYALCSTRLSQSRGSGLLNTVRH